MLRVTQIPDAPQQCTLPANDNKATDKEDNRVQEASFGDKIFARPGRLQLHVVRLELGFQVYSKEDMISNKPTELTVHARDLLQWSSDNDCLRR